MTDEDELIEGPWGLEFKKKKNAKIGRAGVREKRARIKTESEMWLYQVIDWGRTLVVPKKKYEPPDLTKRDVEEMDEAMRQYRQEQGYGMRFDDDKKEGPK
jgi:hypothetical protein